VKLALVLLVIASIVIFGWSWLQYDLLMHSDCSYMQTEDCRARLRFEPSLIFWRAAAFEFAAIVFFLLFRKR
jgi:hypothetical protein